MVFRSSQIIYLIGWAPDSSQPKPMKRGSATHHLRDLDAEVTNMKTEPTSEVKPL